MRVIKLLLVAVSVVSVSFAQTGKMNVKQCVETAIANNIQVKQRGLLAEAAEVNLKQAKANLLPDLNGNFGYGFNQGRNVDPLTNSYINQQLTSSNAGLSSGVILFNGFRLQNLIKQNKLNLDAAREDVQQSKDNLTLSVILAYLQVLSNEDVLAVSKAQAGVTKKQIERMEILVREEAMAKYQLADLKGQLANEEIAIINSLNALQQSKLSLCQLMNVEYSGNLELERNEAELTVAEYGFASSDVSNTALRQFAMVKAGRLRVQSSEQAVKAAKSGFYPSIGVNINLFSSYSSLAQTLTPTTITEVQTGSYVIVNGNQNPVLKQQQNYSFSKTSYGRQLNNNLGTFIGLVMQVPLFNRFQTKNQVKLAKLDLKNAELGIADTKLQLKQNVEQAYLNMTASYDRYRVLAIQVENFEESFRAAQVRFDTGVINSAEYLISKNNLDRAKTSFTQARYDYIFRTRVLDYFQGVLLL